MLIVLDSNILLRAVNRNDQFHIVTLEALRFFRSNNTAFCFFPQSAAEFWNVCTRPFSARGGLGLSIEETDRRMQILHRFATAYPDVPAAYDLWRDLVRSHRITGVQVHDTRIVALMQAHGIRDILTFNSADFSRFEHITVHSPHSLI